MSANSEWSVLAQSIKAMHFRADASGDGVAYRFSTDSSSGYALETKGVFEKLEVQCDCENGKDTLRRDVRLMCGIEK